MKGVFEEIPCMKNCGTTFERGRNQTWGRQMIEWSIFSYLNCISTFSFDFFSHDKRGAFSFGLNLVSALPEIERKDQPVRILEQVCMLPFVPLNQNVNLQFYMRRRCKRHMSSILVYYFIKNAMHAFKNDTQVYYYMTYNGRSCRLCIG